MIRVRSARLTPAAVAVVALLGLATAGIAAVLPANQRALEYRFSPAETGANPAIAPLAIARSEPDRLALTLPCEAPGSQFRSMTLGNWSGIEGAVRSPIEYQDLGIALQVGVGDGFAFLTLGGTEVFRLGVEHSPGCEVSTTFDRGSWTFSADRETVTGIAGTPRFAEALFAGPAATSDVSQIVVWTRELGSSPSQLQILLNIVGLLAAVTVFWQLAHAGEAPPIRPRRWRAFESVDIAVISVLMLWAVIIPVGFDDGWVVARQSQFHSLGAFSNLFDLDGAVLPLAQWIEWLQRFWLAMSPLALVARVPSLLIAVISWFGLRWLLRELGGVSSTAAEWVMGLVFLVGYGAWNISLRPEPVVALLLIASLMLAVRFGRGERAWVIPAWMGVIALAVTAHPAGVIVAAPLIVSARPMWGWLRQDANARWVVLAGLTLLLTLTMLLFFVDSDLQSRVESTESLRAGGHDKSLVQETVRYELLGEAPYGTPMRRLAVGLLLVGVGTGVVAGTGRRIAGPSRLPLYSLTVGLGLLALTPSKWSWHFGGLAGLGALAVAVEMSRLRLGAGPRDARWSLRHSVPVLTTALGVALVSAWAWRVATPWAGLDLRTQSWWAGAGNWSPVSLTSIPLWVGIVVVLFAASLAIRALRHVWSVPEAMVALSSLLVLALVATTLVLDVARTEAWTFGRQNLATLWGGAGCGLGDEVMVPAPGSLRVLEVSGDVASPSAALARDTAGFGESEGFVGGALPIVEPNGIRPEGFNAVRPLAGMSDVGSWVGGAQPESAVGFYQSDWFVLGDEDAVGLMIMGAIWDWDPDGNAIALQWGRGVDGSVDSIAIEQARASGYFLDWSFVGLARPPGSDRVRLLARDVRTEGEWAWVASSMPLGYSVISLADAAPSADVLVSPALGMYFPCVDVPPLDIVVAPTPGVVVNLWRVFWETTYAAAGASDRYFRINIDLDPPARTPQIGAHLGDPDNFVFVSQEYLTGVPARVNGAFTLIED